MAAKGQPRYSSSPSNFVALRGNEVPISKDIPATKKHFDYDYSYLRQSANQLLSPSSVASPGREPDWIPKKGRYSEQGLPLSRLSADMSRPDPLSALRKSIDSTHLSMADMEPFSPKSTSVIHYRNSSLPSSLPVKLPHLPQIDTKSPLFLQPRELLLQPEELLLLQPLGPLLLI